MFVDLRKLSRPSGIGRAMLLLFVGGLLVVRVPVALSADRPPSEWLAANTSADSNVTYAEVWEPTQRLGTFHLHGGLFTPIEVNAVSPTLGTRLGKQLGSHLQGGVSADWIFHRKELHQSSSDLPGLQPQIILARVDAHLVPVMAFLQVNFTEKHTLVPYGGFGMGYEWLVLKANDYRNGASSTANYQNWAWQGFGGIGIRLGHDLRFDSELFYNGGSLERDVVDSNGVTWREAVDVNGVGARLGIDILFQ